MIDRWTHRLSEYIDGELTPRERDDADAHFAECDDCRRTLAELRDVLARAASATPRPPLRDLWSGVAARIDRTSSTLARSPRRAPWRISLTLPQLIAASLALMVVSGSAVWIGQHGGRATAIPSVGATNSHEEPSAHASAAVMTDGQYASAIADLEQTLQDAEASLDPSTVDIVHQNVALIDRAIEQARHALEEDPADIYLNNNLTDLKQQKLAALRQVTAAIR